MAAVTRRNFCWAVLAVCSSTWWSDKAVASRGSTVRNTHIVHHTLGKTAEPAAEQMPSSEMGWLPTLDECGVDFQIPKVAMMFLTRGYLQHHDTWMLWFHDVEGMLPLSAARQSSCIAQVVSSAGHKCGTSGGAANLQQQHLYSVYLHIGSNEDFTGFPPGSLFYGRVIPTRIRTSWGTHSLTVAIRALLGFALEDALNERFVLLSESDVPLYPAAVVWLQLMAERDSRIRACAGPMSHSKPERWAGDIQKSTLGLHHWRRSDTWFALTRRDATAVANDTQIVLEFAEACQHGGSDTSRWRTCFSDQHYFASLLALAGLAPAACNARLTTSNSSDPEHVYSFTVQEVSPQRLHLLRRPELSTCQVDLAYSLAEAQFVHISQFNTSTCTLDAGGYGLPLAPHCPLLARKFGPETADAVSGVMQATSMLRNLTAASVPP